MTTESGEPKREKGAGGRENRAELKAARERLAALRDQQKSGGQTPEDQAKARAGMKEVKAKIMTLRGQTPADRAARKSARSADGGGKKRKEGAEPAA